MYVHLSLKQIKRKKVFEKRFEISASFLTVLLRLHLRVAAS